MIDLAKPIEYVLIVGWKPILAGTLGFGIGFKPTRGATLRASSWLAVNVFRPIGAGLGIATANLARAVALPALTGYALGAVGGTLIAEAVWGQSGKEDAIRLYTGDVSWEEYWDTVGDGLEILIDDWF